MTIASPCTGICKLDDATDWCLGCGRTADEMDNWRSKSEVARAQVWKEIPDRLLQLGVECRRLPWTTDDIRAFVLKALEEGRGTWVMGVVGAVTEFVPQKGATTEITIEGDDIFARTPNGAIRIRINDDVRALTFDPPSYPNDPRIVLAVKRERGRLPDAHVVTDLGQDEGQLIAEAATHLFDLGLGRKEARFCVRVGDTPAKSALLGATSLSFGESLRHIGGPLMAESPTRVVETALGRTEVQGQIPPPDAVSPDGPHTHLLPDHLASNRALPVGMDLPRAYLPGAVFYPPKS